MFQEYPKGLFLAGLADGDCRIVLDKNQEEQARIKGYLSIGESKEKQEEPKRRGRKPKEAE